MSEGQQRRIIIVGGGTAGWMTAAALSRFCIPAVSVTLVESDEIATVGVGEATIPAIREFNAALDIDEAEFLAATGGTYKLGIAFEGWGDPDHGYVHAFGLLGRALGVVPFHHYWLRGRALGIAKPLGHYILNTVALASNRFAKIERVPDAALPAMPYAYHFDAGLYARFLRDYATARGVSRVEGTITGVGREPESGDVAAVLLDKGEVLSGDLFIDCSGFRGLLIEQELQAGFEDWTHWLPCDRAVAVPSSRTEPLLPYTRSIARDAGWQWRIPLQHRTGNGYVFCSQYISEDEATAILLENLDGQALAEPRTLSFRTGKRHRSWVRNVVAIGLSAGFIEPLESTSIHFVHTAINRLIESLPSKNISDAERDAFNRRTDVEIERVRDFIILHYHANARVGLPFWDYLRSMEVPETLKHRMELFRTSGRIFPSFDELFDARGWVQVLIGQGVDPKHWHPLADQLEQARLDQFLTMIEKAYAQDAARMPDHAAFLAELEPCLTP
jgi:tryptophan halogenase